MTEREIHHFNCRDGSPAFMGPSKIVHRYGEHDIASRKMAIALAKTKCKELDPRLKPVLENGKLYLQSVTTPWHRQRILDYDPTYTAVVYDNMVRTEQRIQAGTFPPKQPPQETNDHE